MYGMGYAANRLLETMLLQRHCHGDCACAASECHPWWHQMFEPSLGTCESGYTCMSVLAQNRYPVLLFIHASHKSCLFWKSQIFAYNVCVWGWVGVCLRWGDVFRFSEVLPFLLFKHPPQPQTVALWRAGSSRLCSHHILYVQQRSIFLNGPEGITGWGWMPDAQGRIGRSKGL